MNDGASITKLISPISEEISDEMMANDEDLAALDSSRLRLSTSAPTADFDVLKKVLTQEIKPYLQEHSPLLKRLKQQNKPDKLVCAISYAWGDKGHEAWVEAFAEVLEAAGIDVLLDRWYDRTGMELMRFVETMFKSHYIIVMGTPLYLHKYQKSSALSEQDAILQLFSEAKAEQQEHVVRTEVRILRALFRHSEQLSNKILPVLCAGKAETALPFWFGTKLMRDMTQGNVLAETLTLLRDIYRIDNRDKQFQRFMQRFEVKPSRTKATVTIGITDAIPIAPVSWQLPTWNPKFIERHQPLEQLARVFKTQDTSVITQPYSITGLGGIGKTQLAVAYAHQAKKQNLYGAIVWLNADEALTDQYQTLAKQLALEASYPDTCALLSAVNARLVQLQALVIFDNAKDYKSLKPYLPAAGVKVIITSRNQDWGTCDTLALSTFSLPEVTAYVRTFLPHAHHDDIKALADSLGYLPLAISQALAYMVKSKIAIATYLSRYKKQHLAFLDKPLFADDLHQMTVARTLGLSLQALQDENAQSGHAAVEVLYYTSYLLPDAIPRFLIERLLGDENQTDEALMLLQRYSLLSVEEKVIGVHRLVQVVLSAQIQRSADKKSKLEERLITTLTQLLPQDYVDYFQRSRQWPLMNQVLPHARWLVDERVLPIALLAYGVGLFEFYHTDNEVAARPYLQQAHQQALNLPPQAQAMTVLLLTVLELSSNEPEKIIEKLQQLIAGPLSPYPTMLALGWEYLSVFHEMFSEQDSATKASERALSLYQMLEQQASDSHLPQETGVYAFRQSQLYIELENYTAALRAIDSALQCHDSNPYYWQSKGDMANKLPTSDIDPLACYEKAIALQPDSVGHYFNRGNTYFRLNQPEQALEDYTQAIALAPTDASAYNNRGTTYRRLNQPEQALEDYTQAIALAPTDASAYYNRGITYFRLNQPEQALNDYTKAIALAPTDASTYYNRGNTYLHLNQPEQALDDYIKAIALNPSDVGAYNNRGTIYSRLNQSEQALKDYTQAIALDPTDADIYYNRSITYGKLNQYEQALNDISQAITRSPKRINYRCERGYFYLLTGQYALALEDFKLVIEHEPQEANYYLNRAEAYAGLAEYEKALQAIEQAIQLAPDNLYALFSRAWVYTLQGDITRAFELYEDLLVQTLTKAMARIHIYAKLGKVLCDSLTQCESWPVSVIEALWLQAEGSDRAEICRFLIEFLAVHATALPTQAMMAIEQTQALLEKTSSELPVLAQRLADINKVQQAIEQPVDSQKLQQHLAIQSHWYLARAYTSNPSLTLCNQSYPYLQFFTKRQKLTRHKSSQDQAEQTSQRLDNAAKNC